MKMPKSMSAVFASTFVIALISLPAYSLVESSRACLTEDKALVASLLSKAVQNDASMLKGPDTIGLRLPSLMIEGWKQTLSNLQARDQGILLNQAKEYAKRQSSIDALKAIPSFEFSMSPEQMNALLGKVSSAKNYLEASDALSDFYLLALTNAGLNTSSPEVNPIGTENINQDLFPYMENGERKLLKIPFVSGYYEQDIPSSIAEAQEALKKLDSETCEQLQSDLPLQYLLLFSSQPKHRSCRISLDPILDPSFGMTQQTFFPCHRSWIPYDQASSSEKKALFVELTNQLTQVAAVLQGLENGTQDCTKYTETVQDQSANR